MKWTFSVGQPPHIVMWIKQLIHINHFRLDLHKMVATDTPGCYHTHPAKALRLVLWNGYVEELEDGTRRTWRPGMVGWVQPELCHRIPRLPQGFVQHQPLAALAHHPQDTSSRSWLAR